MPMKNSTTLLALAITALLIVSLTFPVHAQEADLSKPLTLDDCYALALKQSEKIGILIQKIDEVEGQYWQAISTVMPQASFLLTEFHQDSPASNNEGAGSVGSTFNLKSRPERKFKLSQSLFKGFRSLAAIHGAGALKSQREWEVQRGKELLYQDVANAFYGVLAPRDEIQSLQNIRDLTQQRIAELDDRVKLGRSRSSEIANATAQAKTVQAQVEQARRTEIASLNVLRFLTGRDDISDLADEAQLPQTDQTLEQCLAMAGNRSDVTAAAKAVEVAEQAVIVARSDFFPTLSLDSNLYGKRVGFQSTNDWDVTLTFDVPLFEIVKVSGAVKEAEAKLKEARLEHERVLRLAQSEIRTSYTEFKLSLAASMAFKEAEAASAKNYEIQSAEYRLNLVNNLDVLEALQELEDVRRDYLRARYQAKNDANRLKVATGDIS